MQPTQRGQGFLSAVAGWWIPGLGHWIAGNPRRGLKWLAFTYTLQIVMMIAYAIALVTPILLLLVPLFWISQIAILIDGFRAGRRAQTYPLRPGARYGCGFLMLLFALVLNPMLGAILITRQNFAEAFLVPSPSMSPTIQPRDRVVVHKYGKPRRWDVLAYHPPIAPREIFLCRLVGLPGEQVELFGGKVYIDGTPVESPAGIGPYISQSKLPQANGMQGRPLILGPDEYYVLGDDTEHAYDSRYWNVASPPMHKLGAVPAENIVGRATYIYWPPRHWTRLSPP